MSPSWPVATLVGHHPRRSPSSPSAILTGRFHRSPPSSSPVATLYGRHPPPPSSPVAILAVPYPHPSPSSPVVTPCLSPSTSVAMLAFHHPHPLQSSLFSTLAGCNSHWSRSSPFAILDIVGRHRRHARPPHSPSSTLAVHHPRLPRSPPYLPVGALVSRHPCPCPSQPSCCHPGRSPSGRKKATASRPGCHARHPRSFMSCSYEIYLCRFSHCGPCGRIMSYLYI